MESLRRPKSVLELLRANIGVPDHSWNAAICFHCNNVKTDRTTARCIKAMMTYRTIPAMLLVPQRTSQILATHPPGQNQHQRLHLTYVLHSKRWPDVEQYSRVDLYIGGRKKFMMEIMLPNIPSLLHDDGTTVAQPNSSCWPLTLSEIPLLPLMMMVHELE